tara:strand:- start:116 stop:262 length:147 start_codon:yes stop_codon:yes gene_type:complete
VSDNITNRKKINEELSDKDITKIRILIRNEIAEMYFQLYRKRAIWSKK